MSRFLCLENIFSAIVANKANDCLLKRKKNQMFEI